MAQPITPGITLDRNCEVAIDKMQLFLTIVSDVGFLDVLHSRDDWQRLVVQFAPEVKVVHLLGQVELVDALRPERAKGPIKGSKASIAFIISIM